jgi:orotate phosphoribosyltransferase
MIGTQTDREALLQLLVEQSFRTSSEQFPLSSGKQSPYYVDCKQTTLDPRGAYLCGKLLFEMIRESNVDAIAGLTMGADPLVSAVSLISYLEKKPIKALIVRKEPKAHGLRRWVEGPSEDVRRVAVVDDVVTTGKSTLIAIERLQEAKIAVVRVVALVDRNEGGRDAFANRDLDFQALFTLDDILAHRRRHP